MASITHEGPQNSIFDLLVVHVVLVTRDRPRLLQRCLDSLVQNLVRDFGARAKIHILENNSSRITSDVISAFIEMNPDISFVRRRSETVLPPGEARNQLLKSIDQGWIFFIDDDAYLPEGYAAQFRATLQTYSWAQVIGGANLNPPEANSVSVATSLVLAHPLGAGPFRARYAVLRDQEVFGTRELILCNLWISTKTGLRFRDGIPAGEENLLVKDLIKSGERVLYKGDLFVFHERRETLLEFARQAFKYGIGRALIWQGRQPKALVWAETIFLLWFALELGPLVNHSMVINVPLILGLILYGFVTMILSLVTGRRQPFETKLNVLFCFWILHGLYAAGLYWGLLTGGFRLNFKNKHDI